MATRTLSPGAGVRLALLAALAALAAPTLGCGKEATLRPPEILELTVSAAAVDAGESVRLRWSTVGATRIRISAPGQATVERSVAVGAIETAPLLADTSFTLTADGPGGEVTGAVSVTVRPATPPTIARFTASPSIVDPGELVELSWSLSGTEPLSLTIALDGEVVYAGGEREGLITAYPSDSGRFVLTARNVGGEAEAAATVTVNPATGPRILAFEATPEVFEPGEPVVLSWQTEGARGLRLSGPIGLLLETDRPAGQLVVTPSQTTTYRLIALGDGGDRVAERTVVLAPEILTFTATPSPVAAGGRTTLRWSTARASSVEVWRAGTRILDAGPASGELAVAVPVGEIELSLVAVTAGASRRRSLRVVGVEPPVIERLEATPARGSGPTSVRLDYRVRSASTLELFADGVPVPSLVGPGTVTDVEGTAELLLARSRRLVLRAGNVAGVASATVAVTIDPLEQEPNDTPDAAQALGPTDRVFAALPTTGDVDWYRLSVPEGASVRAETGDGRGGCDLDTILELYDPSGALIWSDDDSGPGACSAIDPVFVPVARDRPAGEHLLRVTARDRTTGDYVLSVRVEAPACGDAIFQPGAGEGCDDGAQVPGDGCDAGCRLEPEWSLVGPGRITWTDALERAGDVDVLELTVTATSYLDARVSGSTCAPGLNLELSGPSGRRRLDTGAGCPTLAAGALRVGPGTWWLVLGDDARQVGPPLTVDVGLRPVDVCGNAVVELGEQCDGEGPAICGGDCGVVAARSLVLPGDTTVTSSIPAGGVDVLGLTVTTTVYLSVRAEGPPPAGGCPPGLDTTLRMLDPRTGAVLADVDDTDLSSNIVTANIVLCAGFGRLPGDPPFGDATRTDLVIAPGQYRVEVASYDGSAIPAYQLRVDAVPALVCGNLRVEPGEQCDDGNLVTGDGCGGDCRYDFPHTLEVEPTNNVRAGAVSLGVVDRLATGLGALPTNTDVDHWSFELTETRLVSVEFYRVFGRPDALVPFLFSTARVSSSDGISLSTSAGSRTYFFGALLPPARYEIYVFSQIFFGEVDSYFIDVYAPPLPPPPSTFVDEVEPNPRGAAQPLGGFATGTWTTLRGSLAPGDEDHFSFQVPPGQGPNIVFFLHTTPGVLEGCGALDAQLTLLDANGATTGLRANNVPGSTACPHVAYNNRNNATVRVSAGAAPPPAYYLSIVVPVRPSHSGP